MMPIFKLFFFFLVIISYSVYGQTHSTSQDLSFIEYLVKNNKANDIKVFSKTINLNELSTEQRDSLNYFVGWSHYFTKDLDTAITFLNKVSNNSALYHSANFHSVFCHTLVGKYSIAHQKLKTKYNDSLLNDFKNLNDGAIYLLERNYVAFDSVASNYKGNFYQFNYEEKELLRISNELKSQKKKSPLKALALSAVVPGLGKYYAGYWGKAVSTFIPVMVLGTLTAESLYKAGPKSPQFIILGSLFSVFYLGNLYGTYYSVNIHQTEINNKYNNEILLNVHIPMRRIFNQ